jgi:GNAT superfamily N-acetyltransferase
MSDALSFRRASASDLPAMLALIADDVLGKNRDADASDLAYQKAFDAINADANQHLMLAERDREIIGMLQLTFIPGLSRKGAWRANVEAVRVRSDLRNAGIGAAMMHEAETLAKARGCSLAQLTSDRQRDAAHRFYARLGYTPSHVGFKKVL